MFVIFPCPFSIFSVPRPPRELKFSPNSGADVVEVTWKHCKGRPGLYDVKIIEDGEESPTDEAHGLTNTIKTFKGLVPGTTYNVNVRNVMKGKSSEAISGKWLTSKLPDLFEANGSFL